MAKRSVEEVLAEIHAEGWRVCNIFELKTGGWRFNVIREYSTHTGSLKYLSETCEGETMADAAEGALSDLRQPRNNLPVVPEGAALEYVQTGGRSPRSRKLDLDKMIQESGL